MIGLLGLAIAAMLGLTGCAGMQTSTTQILPAVVEEKPTSDKALIVVEGSDSWAGMIKLYAVDMYDYKTLVGKLGPHGKLTWLRDPGLVDLLIESEKDANWAPGRSFSVKAGESYHCKIECSSSVVYSIAGPGIPIDGETRRHSLDDSLVFLKVLPAAGTLRIGNIKTGKVTSVVPQKGLSPWLAFYLPVGEYNVLTCDYSSAGYDSVQQSTPNFDFQPHGIIIMTVPLPHAKTTTCKINAEFAITKTNVAVYIGDLSISGDKMHISKESDAARAFLEQNLKELPYNESLMKFNQ